MANSKIMNEMQRLSDARNDVIDETSPIIDAYYEKYNELADEKRYNWQSEEFARNYGNHDEWEVFHDASMKVYKAVDEYKEYTKNHPKVYNKWVLSRYM